MPPTRIADTLANESYVNLATFRRNGKAVQTPVWFAIIAGKLYVVTDGTSAKVKRIRATKKIRVAPCNAWGGVTGPWVDGTGRVLTDQTAIRRAHAALQEKYGWQMWLLDTTSSLFGRIGRRAYLELSLG
ncbi:PPOX class F420-dependent oxidoreductase [Candidatus Binatia bacterium]|nr:PPOX class F420-dependent oxidoreductase [Candidatus Binatia bacterium]